MEGYNEITGHVVNQGSMHCETGTPKILVWKFDFSRVPCLGDDQKTRWLWERDCKFVSFDVLKSIHVALLLSSSDKGLISAY